MMMMMKRVFGRKIIFLLPLKYEYYKYNKDFSLHAIAIIKIIIITEPDHKNTLFVLTFTLNNNKKKCIKTERKIAIMYMKWSQRAFLWFFIRFRIFSFILTWNFNKNVMMMIFKYRLCVGRISLYSWYSLLLNAMKEEKKNVQINNTKTTDVSEWNNELKLLVD